MLYDAVIFDLDGTLTDSREGIFNCARYALEKLNWPVPEEKVLQRFLGPPLVESFMRYCGMDEETAWKGMRLYREKYVPEGCYQNAAYPGIPLLLKTLKEQGAYLAVATGKPQKSAEEVLRHFGLLPYFDAVAGPSESEAHADKKDLILRVLPEGKKAVMIGDTAGDIRGGHQAGIDAIGAMWGYGDPDELMAQKPEYALPDVYALLETLCPGAEKSRGMFLTFEGVDGCGKTTQMNLCADYLKRRGYEVICTREPGGTALGEQIRGMLLAKEDNGMTPMTEALLFAASRAQHIDEKILPAVREGKIVLCDRYLDSSLVYQGGGRGLEKEWILLINRAATERCVPDQTLYFRMDHTEALRRRGAASEKDRIEQMQDDFFAAGERTYEEICKNEPARVTAIDASGTIEEVKARVLPVMDRLLKDHGLSV